MSKSKKNRPALRYHAEPKPGKIAIQPTKPCESAADLSLAYSPGVAEPCLAIAKNKDDAYKYTSKGNLVAGISDGTAVLGLGNIGPLASKPVMEGKAVLFKTFANIDVYDLELASSSAEHFIETVVALAPTFGGINLEDIKAPECFYIEDELKRRLDIPVFHDDQHGTAIIAAAALQNALAITGRNWKDTKLVVSGAGAAAIACIRLLTSMGLTPGNITMCDSRGVVYRGRPTGMNEFKQELAVETDARTLADALKGADVFFGLSAKDVMSPEMLLSMAEDPIVFAMANPDPEIAYDLALATRNDVIMATGRSDYPNQVNNVLGFPYIFRGALDVHAKTINEEMKLAAVRALANLARESTPESVAKAYGNTTFSFGRDYLIPKPFDPRVLYYVAPAVAQAAIDSGVAEGDFDIEQYTLQLKGTQHHGRVILSSYLTEAREKKTVERILYAEGAHPRTLSAAAIARDEGIVEPVLVGNTERIKRTAAELDIDLNGMTLLDPVYDDRYAKLVDTLYELRNRKGITRIEAERLVLEPHIFGSLLLRQNDVQGMICGVDRYYPEMAGPILSTIGLRPGVTTAAGLYLVSINDNLYFFTDTTINMEMNSEKLADIALLAAEFAETMNIDPRIAFLSFSNFGSVHHESARYVHRAVEIVRNRAPEYEVDGEMQADTAVVEQIVKETYPFCNLKGAANILVFPDMQSGNIAYKLLQHLGGARVVGPIILGLERPAYVMQRHANVDEIFYMSTVAAVQAKLRRSKKTAKKTTRTLKVTDGGRV